MNRPQAGVVFFFAFRTEPLNDSPLLCPPFPSGQSEGLVLGPRERFTTKVEGPGDLMFTGHNNQQKGYKMKSFITGLPKGRRTRWSMLAAVLAAAGLSVAWLAQPAYQLGGAFVGGGGGNVWNALQIPLDPAGRTAAFRVNQVAYDENLAGLLAAFGATQMSDVVGEGEMINRDTGKARIMGYLTQQGGHPQVCAIAVFTITMQFTGPDRFVMNYTVDVYPGPANTAGLSNADADGDGFPDPGVAPALSFPGTGIGKRVSLQQLGVAVSRMRP
jgi:hypothetical protein